MVATATYALTGRQREAMSERGSKEGESAKAFRAGI